MTLHLASSTPDGVNDHSRPDNRSIVRSAIFAVHRSRCARRIILLGTAHRQEG